MRLIGSTYLNLSILVNASSTLPVVDTKCRQGTEKKLFLFSITVWTIVVTLHPAGSTP
jgi:hypothetical protein